MSRAEAALQTQADVLEAAANLFVSQGYKSTSIEQIAHAAGVAKGTIYIYYKSKKTLFRAVCQLSVDRYMAMLDEQLAQEWAQPTNCIEAVLLTKFVYFHDYFLQSPDAETLLLVGRQIGEDIYAEGDKAFVERVKIAVERAIEANELQVAAYDETAESVASLLVDACHGVGVTLASDEYKQQLRRMIAAFLRGFTP